MFRKHDVHSRRPVAVQARTSEAVKAELQALAARLDCTESEVVHILLSRHFGYDPHTGLKTQSRPGTDSDPPGRKPDPIDLAS